MLTGIKEKLKEYIDTKLQLYQLTIEEKLFDFGSTLLYLLIIMGIFFISVIFLLIGLAKYINVLTNNQIAGYVLVGTLCLLLLLLLLKNNLKTNISKKVKKYLLYNIKK